MTYTKLISVSRWCGAAMIVIWAINAGRSLVRPETDWVAALGVPLLLVALLSWLNFRRLKAAVATNPALAETSVTSLSAVLAVTAMVAITAIAVGIGVGFSRH